MPPPQKTDKVDDNSCWKKKKKTGSDNRLQNRPAVCMGFDRTLTLMTMKNVTSD